MKPPAKAEEKPCLMETFHHGETMQKEKGGSLGEEHNVGLVSAKTGKGTQQNSFAPGKNFP